MGTGDAGGPAGKRDWAVDLMGWVTGGLSLYALTTGAGWTENAALVWVYRLVSVLTLFAAFKLVRRREWARNVFIILLVLWNGWNLYVCVSALLSFWIFPVSRVDLAVLVAVAAAFLAFTVWAIRLLSTEAIRSEFR
ncbi:MAG: hypothetical protein WC969_06555 [Elusimicrobiota bacterium]|jgi:hypothetical protein